jgi:eukaryotic-like serine/threonine-protein kinase
MSTESEPLKRRRIDRYEIHELIGEGGMGAVYRAVDSRLGRTVALKTVVPERAGASLPDEMLQRFMREALAASKVEHRNVVQVIDFGVTGDGTPYLVMEYLRGQDLGVLLRKAREPLAIEVVADIMLGVCAALRACHQLGIVHRDLKPSNIFLADTDTGHEIKVLDFGVSKAPMAGDLTQEGQILGTPQYLSPEQVNGKVGPESDQYALGVLLYVCLTKRLPFEEHQNLSLLRAIEVGRFRGPRAHRPDIPEALEAIILRAMHANPAQRFESVHALGQRLWEFASSRGQVEWKNYYFHSPPVAMPSKTTLRGVPLAPAPPSELAGLAAPSGPVAPVDPTRVLATDAPQAAIASPQLFVSTKLARPAPLAPAAQGIGTDPSQGDVGDDASQTGTRRGRSTIVAVACLALIGIGAGIAYRRFRNLPPGSAPAASQPPPAPSFATPAAPAAVAARPVVSRPPVPPPAAVPSPSAAAPLPSASHPLGAGTPPSASHAVDVPRSVSKRPPDQEHRPEAPALTQPPNPSGASPPASHRKSPSARKKHATTTDKSPKMGLDKNGIGIPSN